MKWILWFAIAALLVSAILLLPVSGRAQLPTVTLDWTAPGDDGNVGTATTYQMRYSTTRPDTTLVSAMDSWWGSATSVLSLPVPLVSGTPQSVTVPGPFAAGSTYYFVLRAADEVPNWSGYSNVAVKAVPDVLPPSRVINLIVR